MDINQILAGLQKVQGFQNAAWNNVVEAARKYAQMKAFGSMADPNGGFTTVGFRDRESYEKHLEEELLREVMRAFREDAMVGTELMKLVVQNKVD